MNPITYYTNISPATEQAVNKLDIYQIADLMNDLGFGLSHLSDHNLENESVNELLNLPVYEHIGFLKGLCDRAQHLLIQSQEGAQHLGSSTDLTRSLFSTVVNGTAKLFEEITDSTSTKRHMHSLVSCEKWLLCLEDEGFTAIEISIEGQGQFKTLAEAIAHSIQKLNKKTVSYEEHKAIVDKLACATSKNQQALAKLRSLIEIVTVLKTNHSLSHSEKNGVIAVIAQITKDAIDCLKYSDDDDPIPF